MSAIYPSGTRELQTNVVDDDIFYVRRCFCYYHSRNKPYCPVHKDVCGVPARANNDTGAVGCFTNNSPTLLIRNAWPVIVLWYGALAVFLLFTQQGRNARYFVQIKCCNSNLNQEIMDNMMRRPLGMVQRTGLRSFGWMRRSTRPQDAMLQELQMAHEAAAASAAVAAPAPQPQPPTLLALKTTRYVAPKNHDNHEDDDAASNDSSSSSSTLSNSVNCTICFNSIENGDRIGVLPCRHIFHVDCLKTWLARRNVCPLCQTPDVAVPRYNGNDDVTTTNNNDEQVDDEHGAQDESSNNNNNTDEAANDETVAANAAIPESGSENDTTTTIPTAATTETQQVQDPASRVPWWRLPNDNSQARRTLLHRRNHHYAPNAL